MDISIFFLLSRQNLGVAKKKGNKNSQPHFSTSILVFGDAEEELYEALDDSKEKRKALSYYF